MKTEPCWICGEPIYWIPLDCEDCKGVYVHVNQSDSVHDAIGQQKGGEHDMDLVD